MVDYKINPNELVETIDKVLNDYNKNIVNKAVKTETKKAMKQLVKLTKDTAPVGKRQKHYKDNITSKKHMEKERFAGLSYSEIWYVKGSDYRLTHLLEHGHMLRNGKRSKAFKFAENAYNEVEKNYIKSLTEAIENGK